MRLSESFNEHSRQLHLELSLQDKAEDVGLIPLNNAPAESKHDLTEKKKKSEATDRLIRTLAQTRQVLHDFSERMDRTLIEAEKELRRYEDVKADRKVLSDCIDDLEHGGVLPRNAAGEILDKDLNIALERYARETNRSTDFSDDAYVLALASEALSTYPTDAQLKQLVEVQTRIVKKIEEGRNRAKNWQKQLDETENMPEEERQNIINGINTRLVEFDSEFETLNNQKAAIFKVPVNESEKAIPNTQSHFAL